MKIKVCGMREPENIAAVEALGIDWMGFIFYPHSPRYVAMPPTYLLNNCKRVGVFVNESLEVIEQCIKQFGLQTIQLHGTESPELCQALRKKGVEVFKALSVKSEEDVARTTLYIGSCDYLLFDTPCTEYGGSGRTFSWSLLESYQGETPFLLSGGIGLEQLEALQQFYHPAWAGIDLNSRFESSPGVKEVESLKEFLAQIRAFTLKH
ncbi:MAG: phosphoribosylanthranilate isomerase [Phocaeicola sp.]